jgi:cellulose synthase/poly-beta-1,6-N-acetylglucosamine synthase-like glycosyltransferase
MFVSLVTWALCALALLLLIPALVLFAQMLFAILPAKVPNIRLRKDVSFAVLIPAHNEEAVIGSTIESIRPQMVDGARLLVVADNCTDATAKLARAAGAEVIERTKEKQSGKGYALDFGIQHLQQAPPNVLLIIDADCQVQPDSIEHLVTRCAETGRPVQSLYLMRSPEGAWSTMRIKEFAWLVKNQVRPLGFLRLGLPCQLMGTGMGLPWQLATKAQFASGHLVEDMKLGIDLAMMGRSALFCPAAVVTSYFPLGNDAVNTQRTRWEHGHLNTIMQEFPRMLAQAIKKADLKLLGLALDLAVPPLALLVTMQIVMLCVTAAWSVLGVSGQPLLFSLFGTGFLAVAILLAWYHWGRTLITFTDLLLTPLYVLAKLPLYLKFWTKRQTDWVRTDRD